MPKSLKLHVKNRTILHGDVIDKLLTLEDKSIDCSVWSPPYFGGLRDYGVKGQWGLEVQLKEYLEKLRHVMAILHNKLKDDGTCWVNLGDSYSTKTSGIEAKSRFGVPERFYITAIDSGWIARNHICWYKNNGMPSSVKDRFTNKWESLFFFTKNRKYYFNLDEVREPCITETIPFNVRVRDTTKNRFIQKATKTEQRKHDKTGVKKQDTTLGGDGKPKPTYKGFNKRWKERKWVQEYSQQGTHSIAKKHNGIYDMETGKSLNHPNGKNPGDAWMFNTQPFPEAHTATFPEKLITRILKAGCPKGGTVLDPFFGAGTTGLVAERLKMKWIGIELKKEYIDMSVRRIKKEFGEIDIVIK